MTENNDDVFRYDHLKDREILILVATKLQTMSDHEKRITSLETARTYVTGVAVGLGVLGFGWMAKIHSVVNGLLDAMGSKGHQ